MCAHVKSAVLTVLGLLATVAVAQTKPVVVFMTTGGTLAMNIDPVKRAPMPAISGEDLLAIVPEVSKYATVKVKNVSHVPFDYMDPARWTVLAREVNIALARPEVGGVIISPSAVGTFSLQAPVIPTADLSITKAADAKSVTAGSEVTYTVVVTNNGPATATGVTLSDPLPTNTTFQSFTAPTGWACTTPPIGRGGTVSCSSQSLAASLSSTFTYTIATTAAAVPMISNVASVRANEPDPNMANNSSATVTTKVNPSVATTYTIIDLGTPRR